MCNFSYIRPHPNHDLNAPNTPTLHTSFWKQTPFLKIQRVDKVANQTTDTLPSLTFFFFLQKESQSIKPQKQSSSTPPNGFPIHINTGLQTTFTEGQEKKV